MRSSLAVSKKKQLQQYFYYLDVLGNPKKRGGCEMDMKTLDRIGKVVGAINKLEMEDSVCHIMESALQFTDWLQVRDVDFARKVTVQFDAFIKVKLAA